MPSYDCGPRSDDCDYRDLDERIAKLEKELQSLKKASSLSESVIIPDRIRELLEYVSEAVFIGFKKKIVSIVKNGALTVEDRIYLEGYLDALRHSGSISSDMDTELREYIAGLLKTDK